jgi:selenocysteine lyase/cysteine desulfurase
MIYLDNAATSFYKPEIVKKTVLKAINFLTANPGRSGHKLSQKVAMQIFESREIVKEFFNAQNYSLIFTKNCSEALNLAIRGCLNSGDHVIATCYEHNSVLRPINELEKQKLCTYDTFLTEGTEDEIIESIRSYIV